MNSIGKGALKRCMSIFERTKDKIDNKHTLREGYTDEKSTPEGTKKDLIFLQNGDNLKIKWKIVNN